MIKKIIIVFAAVLLATPVIAGDFAKVGTAGAQFLKIGVGARYNALGEASVAAVDNIYSMYWNPAGLTYVDNNEIAFTYVNYLLDISLNYIAYARNNPDIGAFGASVMILSMGDQEITTELEQEGTGETYDVSSFAFQFSYARQLTAQFSFGGSIKYIGEKIYREESRGFAFDFGTLLYTGFRSLRLGMNISNLGPEMKFDGPDLEVGFTPNPIDPGGSQNNPNQDPFSSNLNVDSYDLPLTFRIGLAYDFLIGDEANLMVAVEAKHPNDNLQKGSIGAELDWRGNYFLRAGYKINYDEEGLSLGGGIRTSMTESTDLSIDYAWVDFGRFESVHRFSASVSF